MKRPLLVKRGEAADILDKIRVWLAERVAPEEIERRLADPNILPATPIPPLVACRGEAHREAFIDNCYGCAPRWGWTGERIRIT